MEIAQINRQGNNNGFFYGSNYCGLGDLYMVTYVNWNGTGVYYSEYIKDLSYII